ncbi:hypothetical protein [Aeromonas molluscorum]|uniref:hypothetical protein n=1 Tax=Aeromonas molluscorum TaxID=271417 RepID=UPI003F1ACDEF
MRIMTFLKAACLSLMLSACVAPLLMMGPSSQLMWALLKPLVGFDPNEVNLFEQPLIKDRMTALLGPNYDTTVALLKTAGELQQEGPLFYVVSRYTPVPDMAQKAGLVWNSDTNQMAVKLLKGDVVEVFGEQLGQVTPSWPSEMDGWQHASTDALKEAMTGSASTVLNGAVQGASKSVTETANKAVSDQTKAVTDSASKALSDQTKAATDSASKALSAPTKAATDSASKALSAQTKAATDSASKAVSAQTKAATDSASKALSAPTKAATDSASKAVSAQAKATTDSASKAVSNAVPTQDPQAAARAAAEAELEELLK